MLFSSLFAKTAEYEKLAHALSAPGACALFGLPGSGRAMVYAALAKETGRFLCIVTPGEAEATRFAGDLNALGIPTAVFPARDYVLRPIEGTAREYEYRRLSVLGDIVGGRLQAVCVPDEGLTQYTTPRAEFCNNTRTLHPGDTVPRTELTALLYNAGYARRAQVDGPGQFSIRGDIVDLYAPDMKLPVRMEFWGDEIDTMHTCWIISMIRCWCWRNQPPYGRLSALPPTAGARKFLPFCRMACWPPGWTICTPRMATSGRRPRTTARSAPRTLPAACRTSH